MNLLEQVVRLTETADDLESQIAMHIMELRELRDHLLEQAGLPIPDWRQIRLELH